MALLLATPQVGAQEPSSTAGSPAPSGPRVHVIVLPAGASVDQLAKVPGAAIGLLGAGIGGVPSSQTYLDITQGTRTNPPLYDGNAPALDYGINGKVPQPEWDQASRRAEEAPAELVPGLLATTLEDAGVAVRVVTPAGAEAAIATNEKGKAIDTTRCPNCPGLTVESGSLGRFRSLASDLRDGDLAIAFTKPPPAYQHELPIAIAGLGEGELISESTRLDGLVLSTDLAPTILDRLGVAVPKQMSGQPISAEGEGKPAALTDLDARLAQIKPRRGPVVATNIGIWLGLILIAGLGFLFTHDRPRGFRAGLSLLALSLIYLPLILLVTAAIEPSVLVERLAVGVGSPLLAVATVLAAAFGQTGGGEARRWRPLAIAAALTTLAYAVDVVAGSPLSRVSIGGPNPSIGVRFFGIGNELEAILAVLALVGTGAALGAWSPAATGKRIALAFAATTVVAVGAFAPGRFGADVGIAIGLPAGAALAVVIALKAGRRKALLILAAPVLAVAVLALVDIVLGGGAHLTRSVLQAGGVDGLGDVAERRLRLGAGTFSAYGTSPVFIADVILIVCGVVRWRTVRGWFEASPAAWAGFVGAAAATLVGTLANDSGAYLMMIGTSLTSACAGYAWATRSRS